jgi:MoxR-like ATPase
MNTMPLRRLRDSQFGDEKVNDISQYIIKGKMWQAFENEEQAVLLIDEIDKADIEFPNDLLLELDKMEFYCYELQKTIKAKTRPIVIITSNNEKELPDAFLRRCFFHYIRFPERQTMIDIINVHFPHLEEELMEEALKVFYGIRDIHGIKKKPSTSELIDWIRLLKLGKNTKEDLQKIDYLTTQPPYFGSLLKNEQDYEHINKVKRAGQSTMRRF